MNTVNLHSGKMMSVEEDTGVIICMNEGKDMKVKPHLLFQSPGKRKN
jgi:hypothetical protein